jgi:hypothetical protein
MKKQQFPPGWDQERVKRLLAHYESQTEEEAVAEDEAAYAQRGLTMVEVPSALVPKVRRLIGNTPPANPGSRKHKTAARKVGAPRPWAVG